MSSALKEVWGCWWSLSRIGSCHSLPGCYFLISSWGHRREYLIIWADSSTMARVESRLHNKEASSPVSQVSFGETEVAETTPFKFLFINLLFCLSRMLLIYPIVDLYHRPLLKKQFIVVGLNSQNHSSLSVRNRRDWSLPLVVSRFQKY